MDDFELDDVLLMDFAGEFFNQGLRSSKHKTCFSFALGGLQNCLNAGSFGAAGLNLGR